jgi:formylglycine-generating enzyme required for sulfatase activity
MKSIILICIIFGICHSLNAQITSVKFYLEDGSYKIFELNEIQNLSFTQNAINSILNVYHDKTNSSSIVTSIIDTMKFEINENDKLVLKIYTKEKTKTFVLNEIDSIVCRTMPKSYIPVELIPAGEFIMGNTGEYVGDTTEFPIHKVTLNKSFYIGKYEVTQVQWTAVMGEHVFYYIGDNMPVHTLCWNEVIEYCNKLSEIDGLEKCYTINMNSAKKLTDNRVTVSIDWSKNGWRLPTEAEWEYACKAGTNSDYYNGNLLVEKSCSQLDINLDKSAWYCTNHSVEKHLSNVGLKQPNNFGLYDMLGNVYEMCWDWWNYKYTGDETNPTGPASGFFKTVRGGSTEKYACFCRSSHRYMQTTYQEFNVTGFRVCRNN